MKKCLVIVDMQNDFITGSLGTKEAQGILPKVAAKLAAEEEADFIFTRDTHGPDYLSTQEGKNLPVEHCLKGTVGWEIADQLTPFVGKAKAVVDKGAFGSLELPQYLADYDEVELMGLCTDICVISNAMIVKAAFPETKVAVNAACSAGVTPDSHENALAAMKMCQIEIRQG